MPSPYAELLAETEVRQRSVEVLGSTTRYWDYGPEDAHTTIVVVHGYRGGKAPGAERLTELGLEHVVFSSAGTSEDIAMLLAYEQGAELIVAPDVGYFIQNAVA